MAVPGYIQVPPPHHRRYIPHPARHPVDHPHFGGVGDAGVVGSPPNTALLSALAGAQPTPAPVPAQRRYGEAPDQRLVQIGNVLRALILQHLGAAQPQAPYTATGVPVDVAGLPTAGVPAPRAALLASLVQAARAAPPVRRRPRRFIGY